MCPLMRAPRITPLMRAYWRHLVNTIELVLPLAHPTPQLKRKINQFSHFCTAHNIVLSGMHGHVLSPNNCHLHGGYVPHSHGGHGPHLIRFLEPTQVVLKSIRVINDVSTGSAMFAQLTAECRYTLQQAASYPLTITPSHGGSGSLSNRIPMAHLSPLPKWHLDQFTRL